MLKLKIKKKTFDKTILGLGVILCVLIFFFTYSLISDRWNSLYDKNNYNCVDMSYDLGSFFKNLGIPTQVVYGYNPGKPVGHCWLLLGGWLEFESTTLYPKLWDKNSENYKYIVMEDL